MAAAETDGLVNVLKFALRRKPAAEVVDVVDGEVTVDDGMAGMGDAVLIRGCSASRIVVTARKVAKVVIMECSGCTVEVRSTIISGVLEIISCQQMAVVAAKAGVGAHTVTVDMSEDVTLALPSMWAKTVPKAMVACGSSARVVLAVGCKELDAGAGASGTLALPDGAGYAVPDSVPTEAGTTHTQVATVRIKDPESGEWNLVSEAMVREGIGHVTTSTRLAADTERHQRNTARLAELMDRVIHAKAPKAQATEAYPEPAPMVPPPQAPPIGSLNAAISNFNADSLRETETRVTTTAAVIAAGGGGQYGHSKDEDIVEYRDEPEVLAAKVAELAELIKSAQHVVAYTGAGISTAAKIPDYRGPSGVWTMAAKGLAAKCEIRMDQAVPTTAHMALASMLADSDNPLQHIVSTNLDGLHRLSGVPRTSISELHGNCYLERCRACGVEYDRPFDTTAAGCRADHKTGRRCEAEGCDGELVDSIVNFGEALPEDQYATAHAASAAGDVALVLGTSMRVSPACDLPQLIFDLPLSVSSPLAMRS
ncbi:transcriptional regulator [Thecamonas trahens ATCC 50062]|uniref:protein acetyllysine N-acetyltransferase n=1 Tax=Thecamonas trahens ATCC 50062 TaxID=461836 RepID=A0A0L0DHN0_THETB|nr:transcriptional regulator [Thecamonas trahens ATCC 50062]KNC51606.1 transcriptional regulator [Thecamonas trahens ATCC 50062]|eukprot:XP_013756003.1 transcriptional regulator [Thecamonas trahens ATCC 50062]